MRTYSGEKRSPPSGPFTTFSQYVIPISRYIVAAVVRC